jgi:hypothetical protein
MPLDLPTKGKYGLLFKTLYENGLLSEIACNLLEIPFLQTRRYVKNDHFPVSKITFIKFKQFPYKNITLLDTVMIDTTLSMISYNGGDPDNKYRQRWSQQMIRFIESSGNINHKGPSQMGGNLNDLLNMYFEKVVQKLTSKSGRECRDRIEVIRAACGYAVEEIPEVVEQKATFVEEIPEVVEQKNTFVDPREDIPEDWDEYDWEAE